MGTKIVTTRRGGLPSFYGTYREMRSMCSIIIIIIIIIMLSVCRTEELNFAHLGKIYYTFEGRSVP